MAQLIATLLAVGWLLVLADADRRTGRIPNTMVLPACGGTVLVSGWVPAVGVSALVATTPYLVAFAARAVGGADVKLAVPAGGVLADPGLALGAVLVAAVMTAVICVASRRTKIRHGPVLIGAVLLLTVLKWQAEYD
ncbi:A24 family peptidase [Gordonia zhaorongruii]|uniref:A24 family peptidase n=1 Tax=Gordonia zhaorongruii TaxID=2597659 RepID=UPI0014050975|nr:A24 family peptidase [Gordonia zhaorongruii]